MTPILFAFATDKVRVANGLFPAYSLHLAIDGAIVRSRDEPDLLVSPLATSFTPLKLPSDGGVFVGFVVGKSESGKGIVVWETPRELRIELSAGASNPTRDQ